MGYNVINIEDKNLNSEARVLCNYGCQLIPFSVLVSLFSGS